MTEKYDKLVRDKIPEIIESKGRLPIIHTASTDEYKSKLNEKLFEEVHEYVLSGNVGELADLMEVIYAICELKGVSRKELTELQRKKVKEKGRFLDRVILERIED